MSVRMMMQGRKAGDDGSAYASEVMADAPLGYWRLEETSGSSVADSSGNGYTGTASGANLAAAGRFSSGASFAGAGQINFGSTITSGVNNTGLTVEAWVRTSTADGTILTADSSTNRNWIFRVTTGGVLEFIKLRSGIAGVVGAASVATDTWRHVAAVYNGTDLRLYVDGALDGSPVATSGGIIDGAPAPLQAGRSGRSNQNPLSGSIDDPAIFASALSAARLAAHYAAA